MRQHTWRKLPIDIDAPSCIPAHHWVCDACECTLSSDYPTSELKFNSPRDNCYAANERHPEWRTCKHLCWVFNGDSRTSGKCFDCGWRSSFDEYLEFVKAGRVMSSSDGNGGG